MFSLWQKSWTYETLLQTGVNVSHTAFVVSHMTMWRLFWLCFTIECLTLVFPSTSLLCLTWPCEASLQTVMFNGFRQVEQKLSETRTTLGKVLWSFFMTLIEMFGVFLLWWEVLYLKSWFMWGFPAVRWRSSIWNF